MTGAHLSSTFFCARGRDRGTMTVALGLQFLSSFFSYIWGYNNRCIFAFNGSLIFFARLVEMIGAATASMGTVSVLAYLRHLETLDVTRGTAARVQDMAVDIGVVGCRVCRSSELQKIEGAYVSNRSEDSPLPLHSEPTFPIVHRLAQSQSSMVHLYYLFSLPDMQLLLSHGFQSTSVCWRSRWSIFTRMFVRS